MPQCVTSTSTSEGPRSPGSYSYGVSRTPADVAAQAVTLIDEPFRRANNQLVISVRTCALNVQRYIRAVSSSRSDPQPKAVTPPKRKRIRNPEAHRTAILEAARGVFGERGYRSGTIREIAERAGVTHGLVVRHFETKDQLFVAALLDGRRIQQPTAGTLSDLPERIATAYVEQIEAHGPSDPFIALIRSAGDADIAKQLLQAMRREPAAAHLDGLDTPDLDRRSDLLGALLIGVTFTRYILADGPVAMMQSEDLIAYLTPLVRTILLDPLPEAGTATTTPRR